MIGKDLVMKREWITSRAPALNSRRGNAAAWPLEGALASGYLAFGEHVIVAGEVPASR
jgi:hypothetical protein